jgi:hypothetical protein
MDKKTRKALLKEYEAWHQQMVAGVTGLDDTQMRQAYCFTLFSRMTFLYFLQTRGLLDRDHRYLPHKLEQCQAASIPFTHFLSWLLMALDTPCHQRPGPIQNLLGHVPYLRLFPEAALPYAAAITLPDQFFQGVFARFEQFTWDLSEIGDEDRPEITPAILGFLAETYVSLQSPYNRKSTGSFYTPEVLCNFLTSSSCYPIIQQRLEGLTRRQPGTIPVGQEDTSLEQLLDGMDARDAGLLLFVILPSLSICDPANGAASFLVAALEKVSHLYLSILERIERCPHLHHPALLQFQRAGDESLGGRAYFAKKRVLERNLFGVDLQQEPLDVSRLRLYLSLLQEVPVGAELAPLPSLAYSLLRGNSLIGVVRITEQEQPYLSAFPHYERLVAEKEQLIDCYRSDAEALDLFLGTALYARIQECREEAYRCLNAVLMRQLEASPKKGKKKIDLTMEDMEGFTPFHWAYEFEAIMHHPWWYRCDPCEAQIIEDSRTRRIRGIRFGPGPSLSQS